MTVTKGRPWWSPDGLSYLGGTIEDWEAYTASEQVMAGGGAAVGPPLRLIRYVDPERRGVARAWATGWIVYVAHRTLAEGPAPDLDAAKEAADRVLLREICLASDAVFSTFSRERRRAIMETAPIVIERPEPHYRTPLRHQWWWRR